MMKKLVLAALALCALAAPSLAQTTVARYKWDNVRFITSAAANPAPGVVDSAVARRIGAAGASSVLDTTRAISLEGLVLPTASHTGAATDTSQAWLVLHVYDATGTDDQCESGADTMRVAMQVSADGVTWLTAAAVPGQTVSAGTNPITSRNDQTILNGAFKSLISLNGAALANGQPSWVFKYRFRGINQLVNIDEGNAFMWPYVRFILALDQAKGYKIQAKVGRMSAEVE